MKTFALSFVAGCSLALPTLAAAAETATAKFVNGDGQDIGEATLTETPNGVLIETSVRDLPSGEHGFHIHQTGRCDVSTDFESAGGHYAPRGGQHGYQQAQGPHAGDMPNQFVGEDGILRTEVLNENVTLAEGEATLFDGDGSAIVVHADPDDYSSQPSGDAGSRLACAVIESS